jgi:hypothetical protein
MNPSALSVILIPTFRRPVLLRKLLTSLHSELSGKDVAIIMETMTVVRMFQLLLQNIRLFFSV